jgi:hypothetical protein
MAQETLSLRAKRWMFAKLKAPMRMAARQPPLAIIRDIDQST